MAEAENGTAIDVQARSIGTAGGEGTRACRLSRRGSSFAASEWICHLQRALSRCRSRAGGNSIPLKSIADHQPPLHPFSFLSLSLFFFPSRPVASNETERKQSRFFAVSERHALSCRRKIVLRCFTADGQCESELFLKNRMQGASWNYLFYLHVYYYKRDYENTRVIQ